MMDAGSHNAMQIFSLEYKHTLEELGGSWDFFACFLLARMLFLLSVLQGLVTNCRMV